LTLRIFDLTVPWQRIQVKPENAENVTHLIEKVSTIHLPLKERKEEVKQSDNYLECFIQTFQFEDWFDNVVFDKDSGKKKNNAQKIRESNEKTVIAKELALFQLDDKHCILERAFQFPISIYLYIFYWSATIYKRLLKKQEVKRIVILDVIISLNRILKKGIITNQKYLVGFEKANQKFNKIISQKYYDLLFENPILMNQCSFQQRNKEISLYPEQELILKTINNAVEKDQPLLIGNEMPTGQGKSFLAVLLAKMFCIQKHSKFDKKCVLFACPNELVNEDIAANTLMGNDIHLWMAKYVLTECTELHGTEKVKVKKPIVLVRPYKRCFPSTWKKVYRSKKEEEEKVKTSDVTGQWNFYKKHTGRIPDIVVADLKACELLLRSNEELGSPFVLYLDEFNTTREDNLQIAKICPYMPKQTVLLSSILPKFNYIQSIVDHFCQRYLTTEEECLHRVCSADVSVPCVIVDPKGRIRLPHNEIKLPNELEQLVQEMKKNPRIRRIYSPKHVYYWAESLKEILPNELQFSKTFPDIGSVNLRNTIDYASKLLEYWLSNFDLKEKFQEYQPLYCSAEIDIQNIFTRDSHLYEGRTLLITNDIVNDLPGLTNELYSDISKGNLVTPSQRLVKFDRLIDKRDKIIAMKEKKIDTLKGGTMSKGKINGVKTSKLDMMMKLDEVSTNFSSSGGEEVEIEKDFVINSQQHYQKFHENEKANIKFRQGQIFDDSYFSAFNDPQLYQMYSGIGTYDKQSQTEHQRDLVMKAYNSYAFLSSGKDIVYGTNLPGLVNIYIDKSFSSTNTISTIYQLMGRAGRPGRSYHANIFVNDEVSVKKLLSMDDNFERENDIEQLFPEFQEEYFTEIKKKWKSTLQNIYNDLKNGKRFSTDPLHYMNQWVSEQNLYFEKKTHHMNDPLIEEEWNDLLEMAPQFQNVGSQTVKR
jgi:hypothetical protein